MDDLNALVAPYLGIAIVALAIVCVVLLLAVVVLARRTSKLDRRIAVARDLDELGARTAVVETAQRRALQRTGLVRFNPFEDTGGNQSFALALLDAQGSGIVVSSLHSRTGTRVYGKAITAGKAEAALSNEEGEALRLALASGAGGAKA